MSKQVVFYATPQDMEQLFSKIFCDDFVVLDEHGTHISLDEVKRLCKKCFSGEKHATNFYFTANDLKLSFFYQNNERYLNIIESEVIQFNPCTTVPKVVFDTSSVNEQFKKGNLIVVNDSTKYYELMDEFMKNPIYMENPNFIPNGYNHARFLIHPRYYDPSGNIVCKSKKIVALYQSFSHYIKKNFRQSNDKFGYIGIDAYQQHLDGMFVPYSGKNIVPFI